MPSPVQSPSPVDRDRFSPPVEDEFVYSAAPKTFGPFTIVVPNKPERKFVLYEASEAAHTAYRDATASGMRITVNEKTEERQGVMSGVGKADAVLTGMCLVEVRPESNTDNIVPVALDRDGNPVPVGTTYVMSLPHRISGNLYRKVRQMSGMDEDGETVEFLKKRITSDQAKLDRLERIGPPGK